MAKLLNKMLNFVGWEVEEEYATEEERTDNAQPQVVQPNYKKQQNKVVNIHASSQFKVVIMQPDNIDDAQMIVDHLRTKKPVVVNLEEVEKDPAQRIVDFLSGAVYALDGNIQKVSAGIFLIAPNNVDIMGEFNEELKNKGVFPWVK
jgi:cell division inhibitor SepF